jgi:hypothetical protein
MYSSNMCISIISSGQLEPEPTKPVPTTHDQSTIMT